MDQSTFYNTVIFKHKPLEYKTKISFPSYTHLKCNDFHIQLYSNVKCRHSLRTLLCKGKCCHTTNGGEWEEKQKDWRALQQVISKLANNITRQNATDFCE
jgi:hypothetical protein